MKVLLTGIAGFIGWKTARSLLHHGHSVVGIDNLNDYYDPRLKLWRLKDLGLLDPDASVEDAGNSISSESANLEFCRLNIENRDAVEQLFQEHKFDAVINLATRAGVRASIEAPHACFATNAMGSVNLLEAIRQTSVPKYVLASTSSLYAGQPLPFTEDLPSNKPLSPYAASKKAAEAAAYTWYHLYGIDVSICRYFTVYGPAGRPDMAPLRFLKWIDAGLPIQLYGDGTQRRDFTYVDDIAMGTVLALKKVGFEIFNLGSGNEPTAINFMIKAFEEYLGKKAKIRHLPGNKADMLVTQADNTKARSILNWVPMVLPDEGFKRTAEWYLAFPDSFRL